jgi:hypothetical protein
MKRHLIFSSFIIFLINSSTTFPSYSNELFSYEKRQEIIETIDNTCADSWCEGDYNFEFVDFVCNKPESTCDLSFYFINTDNDMEKKSQLQICHFSNITKIEQILDNEKTITDHFYEELDSCISEREEDVRFY